MAKAKSNTVPNTFDKDAFYKVRVTRVVEIDGLTLKPHQDITMKGSKVERIADKIASAIRV